MTFERFRPPVHRESNGETVDDCGGAVYREVEFDSGSVTLRGRLYLPSDGRAPWPAVIMTRGFSATIARMVADQYAEEFRDGGLAVLLYDHRNFGVSDGEPRGEINKWVQTRGYWDATSYASTVAEVDQHRLALWGDSVSAAEAIVAGSIDRRVRAIVAQVPACGDDPAPPDRDGALFSALRDALQHGDVTGAPETTIGPMPVVSFDQRSVPSLLTPLTAYRWFIEYGGRYGTGWENLASVTSPAQAPTFHPGLCTPHSGAALLMVVATDDEMPGASSSVARATFEVARPPKELLEIDGGHFGLLHHPSALFDQVSAVEREFLTRRLREERPDVH